MVAQIAGVVHLPGGAGGCSPTYGSIAAERFIGLPERAMANLAEVTDSSRLGRVDPLTGKADVDTLREAIVTQGGQFAPGTR